MARLMVDALLGNRTRQVDVWIVVKHVGPLPAGDGKDRVAGVVSEACMLAVKALDRTGRLSRLGRRRYRSAGNDDHLLLAGQSRLR